MGRKGSGKGSKSKPSKPGTRGGARAPSALARKQPHFGTMKEMAQLGCMRALWNEVQVEHPEDSNFRAEAYEDDYIEEMLQDVDFYMD